MPLRPPRSTESGCHSSWKWHHSGTEDSSTLPEMPTQHNKPELLGSPVLGTELSTEDNNVEMVGGPVSPAPGAEIPGDGKYPVEAAGEGGLTSLPHHVSGCSSPPRNPHLPRIPPPPPQSHDVHILHLLSQTSKLVVGAAIFHPGVSLKDPKILLLKRATHEQYYPNTYEIPGGKVEAWESVAEAVLREVREETGLDVDVGSNGEGKGLVAALEPFTYYTGGAVEKGSGDGEKVLEGGKAQGERKFCLQLNYVASVKNADFRVHEEEHSGGVWVTEAEVEVAGFGMTEEMRMVVKDAFGWKKRSAS